MKFSINTLIGVLLAIVVGVTMLPTVTDTVENIETRVVSESFTAEDDDATAETFTLDNEPTEVTKVEVEGEEISDDEYTVSGSDVELDDTASDTDDEVIITYEYETEMDSTVLTLIDLLPLLFVIIIVAGAVAYIRFK